MFCTATVFGLEKCYMTSDEQTQIEIIIFTEIWSRNKYDFFTGKRKIYFLSCTRLYSTRAWLKFFIETWPLKTPCHQGTPLSEFSRCCCWRCRWCTLSYPCSHSSCHQLSLQTKILCLKSRDGWGGGETSVTWWCRSSTCVELPRAGDQSSGTSHSPRSAWSSPPAAASPPALSTRSCCWCCSPRTSPCSPGTRCCSHTRCTACSPRPGWCCCTCWGTPGWSWCCDSCRTRGCQRSNTHSPAWC